MTSLKNLITYVVDHKEWIFSGIGVSAIAGLFWLLNPFKKSRSSAKQTINSGARSKNIQSLGDINISTKRKK
jgi:hypothetical protein